MTIVIGTRVVLTQDVENYPTIYAKSGLTGVLVRFDVHGECKDAWVKLDRHFDELNEWDNELQITNYGDPENPSPESYLAPLLD